MTGRSRRDGPPAPTARTGLLSDLQVDLQDRLSAPPRPDTAILSANRRPLPAPRAPAAATLPDEPPVPAFEVRVTPLHWSAVKISVLAGATGILLRGGPVRLAVTLRR